jgi:hypothetical protein
MSKLKIGVIGMSEGNGHPYSWSAIFNGYNPEYMKDCPFPVIPGYLSKQKFPEDGLGHLGNVTHVWTQDKKISAHIAAASNIATVAGNMEDMIGNVDAVLLARDDAENHYEMALPFLKAGIPVFIDKPFAIKVSEAEKMWAAQQFSNQIFTCSSLRYSKELLLTAEEKESLGEIKMVEGCIMKKWETYGIHILEPLVMQLPQRGRLVKVTSSKAGYFHVVNISWQNCIAVLKITGEHPAPLRLSFSGNGIDISKTPSDTFACFKASLHAFVHGINNNTMMIAREETAELVEILEKGIYA